MNRTKGRPRLARINIDASEDFNRWLHQFAKSEGITGADLVEHSLRRYATDRKYPAPPIRLQIGEAHRG